jgi:hypothetical protein
MYNYSTNVKYKNQNENGLYRKQLLEVFNLKEYNDDEITTKMNKLYETIKNYEQIKIIIGMLKEFKYAKIFIVDETEENLYLIFMFSFEYFDLFHNCLKELNKNQVISDKIFNKLLKALDKN